ncbi:D-alanyl-D-alanine carboxypeptidase family protein [Bacillus sp. FJAT-49736]|uniref:D-alanyl-D-alanine carboxypeptidase family protein n=1 Tax=Bacillus sp. FJAT-49736 TaxID=2833582 RepID=UPI001BC9A60B|nr:D-alanyl-D-alanine carboxypeptidase family protein [Bacillus sp. FJAT-49736]MBS4173118.1 D-alanyl-D-alanine carboxypeptidase [Bacillus sp. FJAT-49736]
MLKRLLLIVIMMAFTFSYIDIANAKEKTNLKIASKAAVLVDSSSGQILYGKNPDKKLYPASLTKIATAIYAIENGNLDDMVTVSKAAEETDGTRVYLLEGERVTLKHLVQGLLINSGNDAGVAIADYLCGDVPTFAEKLNEFMVDKVGVSNTHFVNPHGLFDKNHYTTASDLAKITDYAIKNPTFREIFGTKELKWNGKGWHTTLITHHLMLKGEIPYPGITGGKTGYVDQSGQTLATTAQNNNIHLTVITMDAKTKKDEYQDTKQLLDYGFTHFKTSELPEDTMFKYGNKIFKTSEKLLYTSPLHASVSERISKNGVLEIVDKSGALLKSFQLSEQKVMAAQSAPSKKKTEKSKHNPWILMMPIILIGFGVFWSVKRIKNKKKG